MRKHFTLLAGMLLGLCADGIAQTTIWNQDFESATGSALPTGWDNESDPSGGWITKTGTTSWNAGQITIPAHTRYAIVDDWVSTTAKNNPSLLKSHSFDLSAVTGAYLSMDYIFLKVYRTQGQPEEADLMISSDNGANWTLLEAIPAVGNWTKGYFSLAGHTSATTKLAIRYKDAGVQLFGIGVDDMEAFIPADYDVRLDSIRLPHVTKTEGIVRNGTQIKLDVFNNSGTAITSLDVSYTLNGGTAVTQTISGLNIAPFKTSTVTVTNAFAGLSGNTASLEVNITGVNGNADENPADNKKTNTIAIASKFNTRPCLIEEFTSSTCSPCASFNDFFDPLIQSNSVNMPGSNFNIIKYQMNWPTPGDDRSYNPHGLARRNYYGVNSIPDHYTHGWPGGNGTQTEIDACKGDNVSFMDIKATYAVTADSLFATVDLTPFFTLPANHSLHVATVENEYINTFATTTQSEYIHVMRELLTGGQGANITSYTDGTAQKFSYKKKYQCWENGNEVKQGNYAFWSHPMNSTLIVFVQDNSTKTILQSVTVPASWPTTVEERTAGVQKVDLAPNPSTDKTNVIFTLDKTSDVQVSVTDAMGRVVFVKEEKAMSAGKHHMPLSTSEFAVGLYTVKIQTANGAVVKRLSVIK